MKDLGGPAFPTKNYAAIQPLAEGYSEGMSLRDWFAGKAMNGMCFGAPIPQKNELAQIANRSYEMADAMLKERIKE